MSSDLMLKVRYFPWDPDCKHCFIVLMLRLAQLLLRSSSTAVVSINLRLYIHIVYKSLLIFRLLAPRKNKEAFSRTFLKSRTTRSMKTLKSIFLRRLSWNPWQKICQVIFCQSVWDFLQERYILCCKVKYKTYFNTSNLVIMDRTYWKAAAPVLKSSIITVQSKKVWQKRGGGPSNDDLCPGK